MQNLLYPAMQKFYSALNNLDQFDKNNDFFENISCLDNFFSEYRNITFVLQKSLAHTEYKEIYEQIRDKYLKTKISRWFIEKRNEVLKEHPFDLEKTIEISIYSSIESKIIKYEKFSIENDVEYSTLIDSMKSVFQKINSVEVFFSVKFLFYEKGNGQELYEDLILGINQMQEFLNAMRFAIKCNSELCNLLQKKINTLSFLQIPKNLLFIDDYVYYTQEDIFDKASRAMFFFPKDQRRLSVKVLLEQFKNMNEWDIFINMHLSIFLDQKCLMPTFMIFYEDNTFELNSFESSIKTTTYREINELANRIKIDKIKFVFYVCEMLVLEKDTDLYQKKSKERAKYKRKELLSFYKLEDTHHSVCYHFDTDKINEIKYITSVIQNPDTNLESALFLKPIYSEF